MTSSAQQSLIITVMDTATIYEGQESIFRYDLPGTGIVEGWALAGVLDQAEKSAGTAWPQGAVRVLADAAGTDISDDAVAIVARHLRMAGVPVTVQPAAPLPPLVTSGTAAGADPAPAAGNGAGNGAGHGVGNGDSVDAEPGHRNRWSSARIRGKHQVARSAAAPAGGRRHRLMKDPDSRRLAVLLGLAVLALVAVGGVFALHKAPKAPKAPVVVAGIAPAGATSSGVVPGPAPGTVPAHEHVITAGMAFDLPRGFTWHEHNGLVTATGADPNLRILLAADPAYSIPAENLLKELRLRVEGDKALFAPEVNGGKLTYVENPGDGSQVAWTSWVAADRVLSVGCHSRQEATVVHKAACRMATESLVPQK